MQLPTAIRSYLITDPSLYGRTSQSVVAATTRALTCHRPEYACFRDKENADYAVLAEAFVATVHHAGCADALLHGDVDLAANLGADGVHLASTQYDRIAYARSLGLYVVASCHTEGEIETAVLNGAHAVTYSPVFASPGKGEPKGLEDLKEIVGKIDHPIFALGGITTPEQVEQVAAVGVYGFASIRYFV
jgi:thiamine-phosphate pyrophosphorylase